MIKINGLELEESSVFPGGEVHIKLPNLAHLKETISYRKKNIVSAMSSILVEAGINKIITTDSIVSNDLYHKDDSNFIIWEI